MTAADKASRAAVELAAKAEREHAAREVAAGLRVGDVIRYKRPNGRSRAYEGTVVADPGCCNASYVHAASDEDGGLHHVDPELIRFVRRAGT